MTHDFHTFWLHDETAGARYLPVLSHSPGQARQFVASTGREAVRVIGEETSTKAFAAPRPFLDVSAGWAGLARELHRAVESPAQFDLMIGVDIGDVGVASIGLGPRARAVWTARSEDADGHSIRRLMDLLGWRAVNEDIPASDAVYGELDLDSERMPWTDSVDAAIELAVFLVQDVRERRRLAST